MKETLLKLIDEVDMTPQQRETFRGFAETAAQAQEPVRWLLCSILEAMLEALKERCILTEKQNEQLKADHTARLRKKLEKYDGFDKVFRGTDAPTRDIFKGSSDYYFTPHKEIKGLMLPVKLPVASESDRKAGKDIQTTVQLSIYDFVDGLDCLNVSTTAALTPDDFAVYAIVCTVAEQNKERFSGKGYIIITASMVYELLHGKKPLHEYDLDWIKTSLTKMAHTKITIDNRQEAELYNYPVSRVKDAAMLPLTEIEVEYHGHITNGWMLTGKPMLFIFSQERKQIRAEKVKLLMPPGKRTTRKSRIMYYLRDRVALAKSKGGRLKTVKLETIIEECGLKIANSHDLPRIKSAVVDCLNAFVVEGEIAGFKEAKDQRKRALPERYILEIKDAKEVKTKKHEKTPQNARKPAENLDS